MATCWVKLGLLDVTSPGDIPVWVASLYFSDPHNSWVNFNPLKSVDPCTKKKRGNVLIPLVIPLVITPICARSKAFEAPPRLYRA